MTAKHMSAIRTTEKIRIPSMSFMCLSLQQSQAPWQMVVLLRRIILGSVVCLVFVVIDFESLWFEGFVLSLSSGVLYIFLICAHCHFLPPCCEVLDHRRC